jgi:hypothetical protein
VAVDLGHGGVAGLGRPLVGLVAAAGGDQDRLSDQDGARRGKRTGLPIFIRADLRLNLLQRSSAVYAKRKQLATGLAARAL